MEEKEKEIVFGNRAAWQDVEADETTFEKNATDVSELNNTKKPIEWEQWCGVVQQGKPESFRLKPVCTDARAPGPGALCKVESERTSWKLKKGKISVKLTKKKLQDWKRAVQI
eukprot:s574_g22.t2